MLLRVYDLQTVLIGSRYEAPLASVFYLFLKTSRIECDETKTGSDEVLSRIWILIIRKFCAVL
jgi:hypothetical protein